MYLRKTKSARKSYQKLKQKLAIKFTDDRASYTEAKEDFITKILDKIRK